MQKIWPLLFIILIYHSAFSQSPEPRKKQISGNSEVSAFYLQTDRDAYFAGDTIWAKGYAPVRPGNNTAPYSLTVDLVDFKEKKILSTQTFLISGNVAPATIILPIDLASGTYLIRAYSREMLLQQVAVFTKLISVYNFFNKEQEELIYKSDVVFYPEGGNLIVGHTNRIAFAFTDKSGKPCNISGKILNSDGKFVCLFESSHNGMGVFSFTPRSGEAYFAVIDNDATHAKYPLPHHQENGISLTVQNDCDNISFSIKPDFRDSVHIPAFLVLQMGRKAIYDVSLEKDNDILQGTIPVQDFSSGVARLCVFNKDTMLLAERLCFINNLEYVLPATLTISFLNKYHRGENLFSLSLNEQIQGTFAVSVTDAAFEGPDVETQNIYSSSLLTCHLKNSVYNAGKYFDGEYKNPNNLLDLVMMTNSWKGEKWEERNTKPTVVKTGGAVLTGKVLYKNSNRAYINGLVVMVAISEKDSTTQTFEFATDNAGKFATSTTNLFGKNKLLFSAAGKKGDFIEVELDPLNVPKIPSRFPEVVGTKKITGSIPGSIYDSLFNSREYLENVIVKNKQKTRDEILQQRYTTGWFKTLYGEIYDFTDVKHTSGSILDFLVSGYRDIKVVIDSGIYLPKARKIDGSFVNAPVYLNEVRIQTTEQLHTIQLNDVAMIKLVYNLNFGKNGPVPTIAIYTRKGSDFTASSVNYDIKYYDGFSKPEKFCNQVYTPKQPGGQGETDDRLTLLWNPKAATSKRINFIPIHFFNNDFTKAFKLVVEGFTEDGRLLYFEKIL